MSKMIKFLIYVFILLYLASFMYSQTPSWDYNKAENYKNQNFLETSDATRWDVSKVDWSNQAIFNNPSVYQRKDIYKIPQVYKNPSFYKNLPDDKYGSLDYKQVEYDKIDDHRKIDGNKYLKDLGCTNCRIAVRLPSCKDSKSTNCLPNNGLEKGTLEYSNKGISHKNGYYVSVSKSDAWIEANPQVLAVTFPPKKQLNIPKTDSFILQATNNEIYYGNIYAKLEAGNFVLKDGKLYVKRDSNSLINGLIVNSRNSDVRLDFGGQECADCRCSCVSMDRAKKTVVSSVSDGASQSIKFNANNPFIKLQAPFEISQTFGTITVQNRDRMDFIPDILMKFDSKPNGKNINSITDGGTIINVRQDGTVKTIASNENYRSTPIVVSIENSQGVSYLGTINEPKKIIIGDKSNIADLNYNEIVRLQPSRIYFSGQEDVKVMEKARQAYKFKEAKAEIEAKYGVPVNDVTLYLNDYTEGHLIKSIISVSDNYNRFGISPEFLTAAAFKEGLNFFMDQKYYSNPNIAMEAAYLGVHDFPVNVEKLKRDGFLRQGFNQFTTLGQIKTTTLIGMTRFDNAGDFTNVQYAIEAFAASLAERKTDFLSYARSQGYGKNQLSQEQIDYWTYVSYNCGKGCMRSRFNENPEIPKNTKTVGTRTDPDFNSKRVLTTAEFLKKGGLFDKTISQQIALK